MNEREVHSLVDLLYQAALDRAMWPRFLKGYSDLLDSGPTALQFHDLRHQAASADLASGADPELQREYEQYFGTRNVFVLRGQPLFRTGLVITGEAIVPHAELVKTEYYNDYMKRVGAFHALAMVFYNEDDRIGFLVANRANSARPYGDDDVSLARLMTPHVQRAFQLHTRMSQLEEANADLHICFDRMPYGVVVVQHDGRVVEINQSARELTFLRDGLTLEHGELGAESSSDTRALRRLIASSTRATLAAGGGGGVMRVRRTSARRPLELLVAPLRRPETPSTRHALVFVSDPERVVQPLETMLRELYALTPAEARLAREMLDGSTLSAAATRLGVARSTAKSQLEGLFRKIGVSRQAELIRHLCTGVGSLPESTPTA